jgi:phosphoribosyl-ATP pyrophosphohydrolase
MLTLHHEFKEKLKKITALSNKINKNDTNKILEMMKEHIVEIEERYQNNDEHWTIETADLIVLCYELLMMENKDIDDVFNKCLPRFDVKLKRLAENVT